MNTLATVVNLTGRAWAVAADGERREIQVGDRLRGDEMLITEPGARVDLAFDNNQILTFLGEQQQTVGEAAEAAQAALPLSALRPAAGDSDQPDGQPRPAEDVPEGHNFVQLVRINEIIEADGITPLTVARIQEILRPLGMSLPERVYELDEWREHRGGDERHESGPAARTPGLTIELQGAGPDGVYNAEEIGPDGTVPALVTLDDRVREGDHLIVVDGQGKVLIDRPVTAEDLRNGVPVDVPVEPGQSNVTVEATITTPNGFSGTDRDDKPVDNVPPALVSALPPQDNEDADPVDIDLSSHFKDNNPGPLTYDVEGLPPGLSYDPNTGKITGTIDKSGSQGGPGGGGKYPITVTVTDKAGNETTTTFEWTVTNPPPVATDDAHTIDEDTVATGNVISGTNASGTGGGPDNDPDGDELKVTGFTVGGNTYQPGQTATITEGGVTVGTITIDENGNYTFTPEQDWNGTVPDIGYTITDGEGGEDEAKLTITVTPVNDPPVAIGSAPPNQTSEDADIIGSTEVVLDLPNLFHDVDGDTLTYSIDGLPAGLAFDPVTGVISGTIDRSASQSGDDGVHTVTIIATDPDGETAEHTFTWTVANPEPDADDDTGTTLKSVQLEVPAAGGVLENDTDPDGDPLTVQGVVPGAGGDESEAGVGAGAEIQGQYGTLILQADGSYTYLPDLTNDTVWQLGEHDAPLTDTFTYTVSDGEGGTDTAELTITINGQSHTPPVITPQDENGAAVSGHITVYEKGLESGTSDQDEHIAAGDIDITALDGLKSITIGNQTFTLEQLLGLNSGDLLFEDANGKLFFTGFEPLPEVFVGGASKVVAGKLSYTYELKLEQEHPAGAGENELQVSIPLEVTDDQGTSSVGGTLVINVVDDVPVAENDENNVIEDATDPVAGNVIVNDDEGADGATVTDITSNNVSSNNAIDDGNGVLTIEGQYGTLTIYPNGDYTYVLDNSNLDVQGLHPDDTPFTDVFNYTLTDNDGDAADATLTINIHGQDDGVTITVPDPNDPDNPLNEDAYPDDPQDANINDLVVFESGLPNGSGSDGTPVSDLVKVESSFTIAALDGLDDEGTALTLAGTNGETLELTRAQVEALSGNPSHSLETPYGTLVLTGYTKDPVTGAITIDYEYTLTSAPDNSDGGDHTDDHAFDRITITANDRDGDSDEKTLSIKIIDDAPVAENDENNVTEGAGINAVSTTSGNVIGNTGNTTPATGDEADATGADGATITAISSDNVPANDADDSASDGTLEIVGQYGTLTIHPNGDYTYVLDNSNLDVQGLHPDDTPLTDVFNYTLTDNDGDAADATLTINIHGQDDGVTITVPNPADPDEPHYPEVVDPTDSNDPVLADVTDLVVFESGLMGGSANTSETDTVEELVTVKSSFTLSALDGLALTGALVLQVGTETLTLGKDEIEELNDPSSGVLNTEYGELVLTGYEPNDDGTITISYEYTLTSAPNNTDAAHTDEHAFDNISITATDRDGDHNTQTLSIKIIDDAPVAENQSAVTVDEGGETVGYINGDATVTGGENLLANDTQGADGARVHQIRYTNESGAQVESDPIAEGGSVTVITLDGGELTVYSNGDWSYTSPAVSDTGVSAGHGAPDSETDTVINADFDYNLIDGDDDISDWATQPINVTDTVPGVGDGTGGTTAPENATVDEAYLPTGTDPDNDALVVEGGLGVIKRADGIETTFDDDLDYLVALGLKSNGDDLTYDIVDGKLIATARDSNRPIFTVDIIEGDSENARYEFTLQGPLDHYDAAGTELENIGIPFRFVVTDADGDTAEGQFTVTVTDDPPPETGGNVDMDTFDEGGEGLLTTPANAGGSNGAVITLPNGGNPSDTEEGAPRFGTVTIDPETGNLTYTPTDDDFSGEDSFTYTYTPPGSTTEITTTVTVTVNPVADAPDLEADKTVAVNEDGIGEPDAGKVSLGLERPVITDNAPADNVDHSEDGDDFDHPERLGEITLTSGGDNLPSGTTLVYTDSSGTDVELTLNGSGGYTIVIVTTSGGGAGDIDTELHHSGTLPTDNVNYLTQAEYESISASLEEHRHENFEVEIKVSSYEVDGSGNPLDDADVGGDGNGAESTQTITVDVRAITDIPEIELTKPDNWENATEGRISLEIAQADDDNGTNAKITAAINEDTVLDLQNVLTEQFKDTDGSETFWYEVSGLPEGTVVTINGKTYTVGENGTMAMPESDRMTVNDSDGGNPDFTIELPDHYSNAEAIEATITLKVLDSDNDSDAASPTVESVSVDLALRVYAVPDDVTLNTNPSTEEDTPVAFLTDLALIDDDGSETITQVRITGLPTEGGDWVLFDSEGNELTIPPGGDETGGGLVLTIGTGGDEYTLEQIGQFTLLPPAHSSLDGRMTVYITTEEHGDYTVSGDPEDKEWAHDLTITVTPVAEQVGGDTDSNTVDDLTMNDDHVYKTHGKEDGWFTLHAPGAPDNFDLKAPWSNEDDGSEKTFARFTPYTTDDLRHGPEQYDSLDGATFRYYTGADSDPAYNDPAWVEVIYNGAPVDIPVAYLDTLQFKGPLNFKGIVHLKVEAHTIDYDEDDPTLTHEATSGEAWLTNLILHPVADQVTLAVTPRIAAKEDAGRDGTDPIPLNINPISDDPSETNFQVTIKGIPDGATITYTHGGTEYIIGADFDASGIDGLSVVNDTDSFSVTIDNFDIESHPTLTPPQDSNETIRLNVEARSIDTLTYTDENGAEQTITSAPGPSHELPITITLQGVPDEPILEVADDVSYVEETLDSRGNLVSLNDLITRLETGEISGDGSETITLRISGLGEGFSVIGAGPVVGVPNTPEDRVWVVTPEQIDNGEVQIKLPPNYSGTVSFDAQPVVTENDNPSESFFAEQKVSFTVTPSPEAKLNISSNMMEDEVGKIDFSADHQNGDTDEFISAVRFKLADGETADMTFYSNAAGTEAITPDEDGWYTFTDPASIYAKGPANFSGEIKLEVEYKVTDPSTDGTLDPVESPGWVSTDHTLNFQAVTDEIELELVAINEADSDSITLSEAGDVTVKLNISKAPDGNAGDASDHDGSEQLTHILIQGVPDGVAVAGAVLTGSGQWLLPATDSFNGVISKDIVFQVNGAAGSITDAPIRITVVTLDAGADESKEETITWKLSTDFTDGEDVILPTITLTPVDDARGDEDTSFALSTVVSGTVDTTGANQATFDMTITLRTSPDDQTSYGPGLTRTVVQEGGETVVLWTKTVTGLTNSTAEQVVTDALATITVTPPLNANSNANNLDGKLPLDVTVAFHNNGVHSEDTAKPEIELTPVTDEATVSMVAAPVNEGETIEIAITVTNGADEQGDWEIVEGKLYLKLEEGSLPGTLKKDGTALTLQNVEGIAGLTEGQYYVIEGVSPDTPLDLTYEPEPTDPFANGSVKLKGWVQNQENGSTTPKLSNGEQNLTVIPTNTEPDVTITATGVEHNGEDLELARLVITGDVLADSSETLQAAFIEGLPSDFTVYYSSDPNGSSAIMASNAGGGTWSIPLTSNDLPPYVAIQPPAHWSGTLEDLKLYLVSGEPDNEPTAWPVDIDLTIAPVADGVALNPTLSFGTAGDIVSLNLNADMFDPIAASPTDTHVEVTTLELTGLPDGEKVVFYANGVELGRERINFDSDTNTHTITGLTQTELNGLGILHLGTGGVVNIDLKAWTQEAVLDGNGQIQRDDNGAIVTAGNPSEPDERTLQINIADKLPTNGADNLLWTGDLIDGRGGEDTIQLRFGESLDGSELATNLRNIEVIDLSVEGANKIEHLTAADVFTVTDENNLLKIFGDDADSVALEGDWVQEAVDGGITTYTGKHEGVVVTLEVQTTLIE